MTFTFFVHISVVGNAIGAFASLATGLADRWGRANLVTYGLLVTAVLVLVGLPNAPNKVTYLVLYAAVSLVEGMLPVATPALIRDFSPQLGWASAMGFWTLGLVIGGLVVTEVSSNTLGGHPHWQTQSDRPARARLTGLSLPATRIPQWAGRRCRSLSRVIPSLGGTRPPSAAGQAPDGDATGRSRLERLHIAKGPR